MNARDALGVLIRAGGLILIVFAIFDLVHLIATLFNLPLPSHLSAAENLTAAIVWTLTGVALFAGANLITRLAYGRAARGDPPAR